MLGLGGKPRIADCVETSAGGDDNGSRMGARLARRARQVRPPTRAVALQLCATGPHAGVRRWGTGTVALTVSLQTSAASNRSESEHHECRQWSLADSQVWVESGRSQATLTNRSSGHPVPIGSLPRVSF